MSFMKELTHLVNKYSKETNSNTPDYLLASYMLKCLNAYEFTITERARWNRTMPDG